MRCPIVSIEFRACSRNKMTFPVDSFHDTKKAGVAATLMPKAGSCRLAPSMQSTLSGCKLSMCCIVILGKPCSEGDVIDYLANASRLLVTKLRNWAELARAF